MEIVGVGYRAARQGQQVSPDCGLFSPRGNESGSRYQIEVPTPTEINVKGSDKELVGRQQVNIRDEGDPSPTWVKVFAMRAKEFAAKEVKQAKLGA